MSFRKYLSGALHVEIAARFTADLPNLSELNCYSTFLAMFDGSIIAVSSFSMPMFAPRIV